jgi:hypothetical protein
LRELLDRGADSDADADRSEVRDLVDDGGMVRITN